MPKKETKIDKAWQLVFQKKPVLKEVRSKGFFEITADELKALTKEEPRLIAKIDFREHLPEVMKAEGLSLLAVADGIYRVGGFNPYIDIEEKIQAKKIETTKFPDNIITLNPAKIAHESALLDAAFVSGIMDEVFQEKVLLTIRGRSRFPKFNVSLNGVFLAVDGVQIEVDGGYEGRKAIHLVEAKIGSRNNINIRQLAYPHMAWESVLANKKQVLSYVCFYQEPNLRFIPIVKIGADWVADHGKERVFVFEKEAALDLLKIQPTQLAKLPVLDAPFPQANDFEKVLAILAILARNPQGMTRDELFEDFDIDKRQHDYYGNVLKWLGLAEFERSSGIKPTRFGSDVALLSHAAKITKFAEIIFSEPIFNYALRNGTSSIPKQLWVRWRVDPDLSTAPRRLGTVEAWIKYFKKFDKN